MGRASRQVAGDRRRRETARGCPGGAPRPASADERDVQDARDWTGGRRVRDPPALDGLFPVDAPGTDLDRRRAGSPRGHRDHPLLHQHLAEHRVVHGLDHEPGRLRVELGAARGVHERPLEGGEVLDRGSDRRVPRPSAGDPDDRLRDDHRHGADGTGARAGERDAGPARPGGDRRAGDVDVGHLAGGPLDLRTRDRPEGGALAVDLPGGPREPALRPGGLRRRGQVRRQGSSRRRASPSRLTRNPTDTATPRTAATRGPNPPSPKALPLPGGP